MTQYIGKPIRTRQRFVLLATVMTAACVSAMAIMTIVLFREEVREIKEHLRATVQSQARLIGAVTRYDAKRTAALRVSEPNYDPSVATQGQVADAHRGNEQSGRTTEFTLARREGELIVFLLRHRHGPLEEPGRIPFASDWAEPMRRALEGRAGTVIDLDYRGETFVAAYEPVEELGMGIVAKIDLAEIRAPFVKAVFIGGILAVVCVVFGTLIFFRLSNPVIIRLEKHAQDLETEIGLRQEVEAELAGHRERLEELVRERTVSLAESEQRYRTLTDAVFEGVAISEQDTIIEVNSGFALLFGYERDELAGKSSVTLVAPQDWPKVSERIRLAYENPYEVRAVKKNGSEFDIEVCGKTILYEGRQCRMTAVRDITERKRAKEELLASHEDLRRLATRLSVVEDQERRRFANLLHDQIGQDLAVLRIRVDQLAANTEPQQIGQGIASIREILDQAIDETRNLTYDLSPPVLYLLGLVPAIEWIGERISDLHGLTVDFVDDGQPKAVDHDLAPMLFRAVRELLMNVVKHADASRVEVNASRQDRAIRIVVEDDGTGFDASRLEIRASSGGFGLFSIRRRIVLLGGSLVVESSPGAGTRATLAAPLQHEAQRFANEVVEDQGLGTDRRQ